MRYPEDKERSEQAPQAGRTPAASQPARVRSDALLGAAGLLIIEHEGREYRLRQTRAGKLILTA